MTKFHYRKAKIKQKLTNLHFELSADQSFQKDERKAPMSFSRKQGFGGANEKAVLGTRLKHMKITLPTVKLRDFEE